MSEESESKTRQLETLNEMIKRQRLRVKKASIYTYADECKELQRTENTAALLRDELIHLGIDPSYP